MGTLSQLGKSYVAGDSVRLLDGRLLVDPPPGAVLAPVPPSLMGAPAAVDLGHRAYRGRSARRRQGSRPRCARAASDP